MASQEKPRQLQSTQLSVEQQTQALAALALQAPQATTTASRAVAEESNDDVIYTNHFPCSFARDLTFYQYDAMAEEFHEKEEKYINFSNREKRRRFVSDLLASKELHPSAVCWYDEGRCIYSTSDLSEKLPLVCDREEQGRQYRLTIKSLTATSGTGDLDQSAVRIIETLIKQALKDQFKSIGQVFYRWDEKSTPDGPYDFLPGFKQALCLTEAGPTLNVDTTITRFYPHSDLLPFIWERVLRRNEKDFPGWIPDNQYYEIANYLRGIEVTTLQSDHQKKYVLTGGFSDDLPERIPIDGHRNLLEYYKHLGYELKFPRLYLLKAHKPGNPRALVDLPIELCSLREWQQVNDEANTTPVPAAPVHERYRSIMRAIQSCDFRTSELCREIHLQVHCEEMMAVNYETLAQRQIISRQGGLTNPVAVERMAFIYLTDRPRQNAQAVQRNFLDTFREVARRQRMRLPQRIEELQISDDGNLANVLLTRLSELKKQRCEFILCLENCQNPSIHELFKKIATVQLGLLTQCANYSKIQASRNLRTYCNKLMLSVNAKLSGSNKEVAQLQTSIRTMYIGADVQHTKNNFSGALPSMAAVVASMDSGCTLTNQRVSRQWPREGRQSEESILLLQQMVEELLRAYQSSNQGALPEEVVFYRDGVDDGQFQRVLDEEVTAVRQAFARVYPAGVSHPQLIFLVVKKRHHTRLFRLSPPANVESGVVVDSCIVHEQSNYPNFFLNSHAPRLGTNKIGNYVLLINEPDYPLFELEEMTYSLCHIDQRTDNQTSESIPSILHLADAAASKARQLFNSNTRPANGNRAEVLQIHPDMRDTPNMF